MIFELSDLLFGSSLFYYQLPKLTYRAYLGFGTVPRNLKSKYIHHTAKQIANVQWTKCILSITLTSPNLYDVELY